MGNYSYKKYSVCKKATGLVIFLILSIIGLTASTTFSIAKNSYASTVITAKCKYDSTEIKKSKKCKVLDIDKVKWVNKITSVERYHKEQLVAQVMPQNAYNTQIKFKSSNTKIATVNSQGVIYGKKKGVVTITAAAANKKAVKVRVTVTTRKNAYPSQKWVEYDMRTYCVYLWSANNKFKKLTCNTAKGKPSTPTITGHFRVYSKVANTCMPNDPDPAPLCNIHWTSYWGRGGYAFHEAWWLTKAKLRTGISHGCINMYRNDAKKVYDFVSIGTPVWVHK